MSRRLVRTLLTTGALLLLLSGGLVLFRLEIATALVTQQLEARGGAEPELQVTALNLDGATVEAIRLGENGELRIGRLALVYDWRELGDGRLQSIDIEDAEVKLNLTGEGHPLGSLQSLIASLSPGEQDAGDDDGPPVPPVTFTGGRILAETPEGPITLETSGVLELTEGDRMEVSAQVAGEGAPGRAEGQLEAQLLDGLPTRLVADLTLSDFALPRVTAKTAQLSLNFSEQSLAVDLDLETEGGRTIFSLFAESGAPILDLVPALTGEAPLDALAGSGLSGQGALTLESFDLPQVVRDVEADLVFDLTLRDGGLAIAFPSPARVSGKLAAIPLRQAGLPDGLLAAFSQPLDLLIAQATADTPALHLGRSEAGVTARTGLDVKLGYGFGSRLAAELRGNVELSPDSGLLAANFPNASLAAENLVAAGVRLASGAYRGGVSYDAGVLRVDGRLEVIKLDSQAATLSRGVYEGQLGYAAGNASLDGRLDLEGLDAQGYQLESAAYDGEVEFADGDISAQGRLNAAAESFTAGAATLQDVTLDAPIGLEGTLQRATLAWTDPARLAAGGLGELAAFAGEGLTATSERGRVALDWSQGFTLQHDLILELDPGDSEIAGVRTQAAPLSLSLIGGTGDAGAYRLEVSGESESLALPAYRIRASGLTLDGMIEGQDGAITLRIARLADQREPQILPPLSASVTAKPTETGFAFDIAATGAGGRLKANATARLNSETGRGSASFKLAPLLFVPGALQPVDVAPLLSGLTKVQAEMRSEGELAWNRNGLTESGGEIRLDNASMTTGAGRVEGLTTAIELTSLWPPLSAPSQELIAKSYTTNGVTFTDLEANYRLVEGDGAFPEVLPLLLVEHAQLKFGRGLFEVSEVLIDPLSDRQAATVGVEGLELKDLFDLADIEDVTGEGPMSGSVPIRIQGDDIVIEDGYLESTSPGIFKIQSAEAKAALQGAGDYVDLVLQALENFQYERLSIALNKPADGNSVLQLKVLGSNPDVLDGHPFDINLNLETDLGPLLDALTAGQRLSQDLMERIRQQRQDKKDGQE